jgi:hypothetical protein
MKQFPKDCNKECPHFRAFDMSVDNWVYRCTKLQIEVDGCDAYSGLMLLPLCPLNLEELK